MEKEIVKIELNNDSTVVLRREEDKLIVETIMDGEVILKGNVPEEDLFEFLRNYF